MRIIIAGAGQVGTHLARLLSNEAQDIVVVDPDSERLAWLDANLNLMTLSGDPTSFATLREAGAAECDLFIAVTPYESQNLVASSFAKSLGAKRTVARIDSFDLTRGENRPHLKHIGVDRVIYPEQLAAEEMLSSFERTWIRNWFELNDGQIIVAGVKVRAGAPITGMALKDFGFANRNFHVSAIKRNHMSIIPRGDDRIEAGDILYITTTRDHIEDLPVLAGKTAYKVRRVLIMGASKMAIRLANLGAGQYKFTIVDNDLAKCRRLPMRCPDAEIIHGDARDPELLADLGIEDIEGFAALTDSSETNILACLTAKELGVKKTIANVENIQFISQAENLNIGTVVNKKLLACGSIFQLLLDSDSSTSKCLALADAEVAEIEVRKGSKVTRHAVRDLGLPSTMTMGGLIRDGHGMLITGATELRPGDKVVVFTLAGNLHKVEKLFV